MKKIFFAGAGTAGHVEPALAVARWFKENHPEIESHFLGTQDGVENTLVPAAGFALHLVDKVPFPRRLSKDLLIWPWKFKKALRQTREILTEADLVIGFGGYVAAPAYLSARRAGIPIVAHEANAKMGMANKLGRRCGAIMLRAFGEDSPERVGIPLRNEIVELATLDPAARRLARAEALRSLNFDPQGRTILVFGGSLGSMKFNDTIAQSQREISRRGYQIIHAVGAKNELPVAQAGYLPMSYIDGMARAYAASDLVISRSGAVTVTEVGVLGIYSLFVPLPIGNGEQSENAKVITESGGGELINNAEFTSAWLLANVDRLMESAENWSATAKHLDFPLDASAEIAHQSLKVLADE